MFCTICSANQAVVGSYKVEQDSTNSTLLDENAATLANEQNEPGPMQITRIPMPDHRNGNWRAFTNVIYANGTLLVPQYGSRNGDLDKIALETYRKVLPNWEMIGIDCSKRWPTSGASCTASRSTSRQYPAIE